MKKNRGFVTRWKVGIILIFFMGIVIFNYMFKDKLITNAVEAGLESVFNADAEVRGLSFSLLKGDISFESLEIADQNSPYKNLFDTGRGKFKISIPEITRGRIRIDTISLEKVQWGTPRTESGSLEKSGGKIKTSISVGKFLRQIPIDYKKLIEEKKSNLKSLNLLGQVNKEKSQFTERWKSIFLEEKNKIKDLSGEISKFQSLVSADNFSIEKGKAVLSEGNKLSRKVSSLENEIIELKMRFETEKQNLLDVNKNLNRALTEDISYLGGYLNLSPLDYKSLFSSSVEKYLRVKWKNYYNWGLKAYDILKQVVNRSKANHASGSGSRKILARANGRDIPMDSSVNPDFLIEKIILSGSGSRGDGALEAVIRSITTQPEKLNTPLSFEITYLKGGTSLLSRGTLDLRKSADKVFTMTVNSAGSKVTLGEGLSAVGVKDLSCTASISGEFQEQIKGKKGILGNLEIKLTDIDAEYENPGDISIDLSYAGRQIFDSLDSTQVNAEIFTSEKGLEYISVSSPLDKVLFSSVKNQAEKIAAEKGKELKAALLAYLEPSLKESKYLDQAVKTLENIADGEVSSVNGLEKVIYREQRKVKDMAAEFTHAKTKEAVKKAGEEASKILNQAVDKIKLPGF